MGIQFFYSKQIATEETFVKIFVKIENVLKFWRMRNLTLEDKVIVFKDLGVSKIIHLKSYILHLMHHYKNYSTGNSY